MSSPGDPQPGPATEDVPASGPPPGRPRSGLVALGLVVLVLVAGLATYLLLEGDSDEGGSASGASDRLVGITDAGVVLYADDGTEEEVVDLGAAPEDVRPRLVHAGHVVLLVEDEVVAVDASDGSVRDFDVPDLDPDWMVVPLNTARPLVALGSPAGEPRVVVLDLADGTVTEVDGGEGSALLPFEVSASTDGSTLAATDLLAERGSAPTIVVRAGGAEVARIEGTLVAATDHGVITRHAEDGGSGNDDGTAAVLIHDRDGELDQRVEIERDQRTLGLPDGRVLLLSDGDGPLAVIGADGDLRELSVPAPDGDLVAATRTSAGERVVVVTDDELLLLDADLEEVARGRAPDGPISTRVLDGSCVPFGMGPEPTTVIDLRSGEVVADGREPLAASIDRCALLVLDGTELTSTRTGATATVAGDLRVQAVSPDGERYVALDGEGSTASLATMDGADPVRLGRGWFAFVPLD